MCINFNGYYSGGSIFVNVNDCWLLQKLFVYHRYKFSLEKKKKKKEKESQYMVSHPENGSDSPIGSDRDRGRDRQGCHWKVIISVPTYNSIRNMQRPNPLLKPIDTGLSVINNRCRGHNRMWRGLSLTK